MSTKYILPDSVPDGEDSYGDVQEVNLEEAGGEELNSARIVEESGGVGIDQALLDAAEAAERGYIESTTTRRGAKRKAAASGAGSSGTMLKTAVVQAAGRKPGPASKTGAPKQAQQKTIPVQRHVSDEETPIDGVEEVVPTMVHTDASGRPKISYPALIRSAIACQHDKKATLQQIYDFISSNYPYYRKDNPKWQNAIRHTLSLHRNFIRLASDKGCGKGGYWAVEGEFTTKEIKSPRTGERKVVSRPPTQAYAKRVIYVYKLPAGSQIANGKAIYVPSQVPPTRAIVSLDKGQVTEMQHQEEEVATSQEEEEEVLEEEAVSEEIVEEEVAEEEAGETSNTASEE